MVRIGPPQPRELAAAQPGQHGHLEQRRPADGWRSGTGRCGRAPAPTAGRMGARPAQPVTIAAGEQSRDSHVTKRDLLSALLLPLQQGRLRVAAGLALGEVLERELVSFRMRLSVADRDSCEVQRREGEGHGDLVIAVSLAARRPNVTAERELVEAFRPGKRPARDGRRGRLLMPAATDALAAVVSTVRTAIGLTKAGRLRDQMVAEVELLLKLKEHEELEPARKTMAELINNRAVELAETDEQRWKPEWGSAAVGFLFTLGFAAVFWFFGVQQQGLWRWIVIVVTGVIGALCLLASISLVARRSPKAEDDDSP